MLDKVSQRLSTLPTVLNFQTSFKLEHPFCTVTETGENQAYLSVISLFYCSCVAPAKGWLQGRLWYRNYLISGLEKKLLLSKIALISPSRSYLRRQAMSRRELDKRSIPRMLHRRQGQDDMANTGVSCDDPDEEY